VSKKQRLIWRYAILGALSIGAILVAAVTLLDRGKEVSKDGLIPGLTDELAAGIPASAPKLQFSRVPIAFRHFEGKRTHRLPEDMGSGVAMEDFDGDGRKDLFFVNLGPMETEPLPCALFANRGDMRFERVDVELPALMGQGVAVGDFDGDSDFDIYVTGYSRNVLLRNDGDFKFTDVTAEAGVAGGGYSTGACWGDADGDGDLDLYVCRYVEFDESMPVRESKRGSHGLPVTLNPSAFPAALNLLYLNNGEGGFREAAEEFGVHNPGGKSLGAVFADLDGDGTLDLYVANDVSDNALYRGRKGLPFEDATHPSCTADWRGAMGLALGDPDVDGDLDMFITHWLPEENTLYVKESGDLLFRDDSVRTYLGPPSRGLIGWACDFCDMDNDGLVDLYVVNGSTFEEPAARAFLVPMLPQLFWNSGRRFFDLASTAGPALQQPIVGRGGASGDLDGDGDIDIVIVAHGAEPLLLRNDTETGGGFLDVTVRGSAPNVFAYGARVTVTTPAGTQVQEVGTRVSYLSSGPHTLHFGLGKARTADVTVRFLSGKTVTKRGVPARIPLVVKEVDPRTLGGRMDAARDAAPDEARRIYGEVLELDPAHPGALYNLALLVEPEDALALCNRLLAVEPMAPRGHLLRARIRSNPARPTLMDLDAALSSIARARQLNRDETGGLVEEGRILLLKGEPRAAAERLTHAKQNPRAAALGALCFYRAGDPAAAKRLLALHHGRAGPQPGLAEEGDTAGKKMGSRDLLASLLELESGTRWSMVEVRTEDDAAPASATRLTPYDFDVAARWALQPPELCDGVPPGTTAQCEADIDGDGDLDLVVACGGYDPAAPLPWWVLLKEEGGYKPVRGDLPRPGFCVRAVAAADLDKDGRAKIFLVTDEGDAWLASLR